VLAGVYCRPASQVNGFKAFGKDSIRKIFKTGETEIDKDYQDKTIKTLLI
jgi:hypothetical protein